MEAGPGAGGSPAGVQAAVGSEREEAGGDDPRPELTFLLQGEREPMSIMRRRTDPDEFDI